MSSGGGGHLPTGIEGQSPVFKEAQEAGRGGRRARGPSEAGPLLRPQGLPQDPRTAALCSRAGALCRQVSAGAILVPPTAGPGQGMGHCPCSRNHPDPYPGL